MDLVRVIVVQVGISRLCSAVIQVDVAMHSYNYAKSVGCLPYMMPGLQIAAEEINSHSTVFGEMFNVSAVAVYNPDIRDCATFEFDGERLLAEWYYTKRRLPPVVSVPFITGCYWNDVVNRYALEWDQLVLVSTTFGNKELKRDPRNRLIMNSFLGGVEYFKFHAAVLDRYNWSTIFVLHDATSAIMYKAASDFVRSGAIGAGKTVYFKQVDSGKSPIAYGDVFREYVNVSRVFCYFGDGYKLRMLMTQAWLRNLTNGEHVYLAFEPAPDAPQFYGGYDWYSATDSNETNEIVRQAYRSVLIFATSQRESAANAKFLAVTAEMRRRSLRDYNLTYPADGRRTLVVCAYSLVFMLLQVLSEALLLNATVNLNAGSTLTRLFLNRTFVTPVGSVYIDSRGERGLSLSLNTFDATGQRLTVGDQESPSGRLTFYEDRLEWPAGHWPPPNLPLCGYDGLRPACFPKGGVSAELIKTGIGVGVAVAALFFGVLLWAVKSRRFFQHHRPWLLSLGQVSFYTSVELKTNRITSSSSGLQLKSSSSLAK